jgi:hypothetical protein
MFDTEAEQQKKSQLATRRSEKEEDVVRPCIAERNLSVLEKRRGNQTRRTAPP